MHAVTRTEGILDELFQAIDAMDSNCFASFLTDNSEFRFGSAPPVEGRQAIRDAVQAFFASISGLSHNVTKVWRDDSTVACEGEVCYQRHDGSKVTIPFVDVFAFQGTLISCYKIYIDIGPLYAA